MKRIKSCFILFAIMLTLAAIAFPLIGSTATTNYSESVTGVQVIPVLVNDNVTDNRTVATFKMPFKAKVIGISAHATTLLGAADNGTAYYVDVKEDGTSILSTPLRLWQGTVYEASISDSTLADESTLTITVGDNGTTTNVKDLSILLTIIRKN